MTWQPDYGTEILERMAREIVRSDPFMEELVSRVFNDVPSRVIPAPTPRIWSADNATMRSSRRFGRALPELKASKNAKRQKAQRKARLITKRSGK